MLADTLSFTKLSRRTDVGIEGYAGHFFRCLFGLQTYLSMLCAFKWGIFIFFAGMVLIMTTVVAFFYPETKGFPIEEAPHVFADHWCACLLSNLPLA